MKISHAIIVTFNEAYLDQFRLFSRSLNRYWPDHPDLLLLHKGLTIAQIDEVTSSPRVFTFDISAETFETGPGMLHRKRFDEEVFYARFLIWKNGFRQYDKILYCDIDALVIRPLDELFAYNEFVIVKEAYRGEKPIFYDHRNPDLQKLLEEDGITGTDHAINCGMFMIPSSERTHANYNNLVLFVRRYEPYLAWGDQSVINLWCLKKNVRILDDFRYNFQIRLIAQDRVCDAYRDVKLLHFNGYSGSLFLLFLMQNAYLAFRCGFWGRWVFYRWHHLLFAESTFKFRRFRKLMYYYIRVFHRLFMLLQRLGI
jgi:lipopolysaccharide biosynthesis glycosyltransferase